MNYFEIELIEILNLYVMTSSDQANLTNALTGKSEEKFYITQPFDPCTNLRS